MQLLLIGGAGHLGSIVRPALEREHTCRYLDTRPVPDAADRTIVADVNDDDALRRALAGVDAVLYMTLGAGEPYPWLTASPKSGHENPDACMQVNVLGLYRALLHALDLGVRRFVHASTLSVYASNGRPHPIDESREPDAWTPYGLSKRLAEEVCRAATQREPEASVLALRLVRPCNESEWAAMANRRHGRGVFPLAPGDTQRLYRAAVEFDRPGFHVAQAASDVTGEHVSYARAHELIGWKPEGS